MPASLEIKAAIARDPALANVPGIGELDNGAVVVLWLAALDAERRRSREDTFWGPYLRSLPQDILELPNEVGTINKRRVRDTKPSGCRGAGRRCKTRDVHPRPSARRPTRRACRTVWRVTLGSTRESTPPTCAGRWASCPVGPWAAAKTLPWCRSSICATTTRVRSALHVLRHVGRARRGAAQRAEAAVRRHVVEVRGRR